MNSQNFLRKIRLKIGKFIIKYAPLNRLRIHGLRVCHFIVGKSVYIGEDCIIINDSGYSDSKLIIGNRVSISPRATFILSSHPNHSQLSKNYHQSGSIIIGDDCWIGTGAIIYPKIKIGNKSIVGSGSVVTKNIDSDSFVAGIPAHLIKKINL